MDKLPLNPSPAALPHLPADLMVWVLVPKVETGDPNIDYYYDFSQSIDEYTRVFKTLGLPWRWQPVKMDDFREIILQIPFNSEGRRPLVLNLCDGDEVNGSPGISVLRFLEETRLPHTGADAFYYIATTSKLDMKRHFADAGVPMPGYEEMIPAHFPVNGVFERLGRPLIVKPAVSAGSMGISVRSVVDTKDALEEQVHALEARYRGWSLTTGGILAEQFINGAEYTSLVVGPWDNPSACKVYTPVERVFHPALPERERFLSFDRLWEIYETENPIGDYEDFYTYELPAPELIPSIKAVSLQAYKAVRGTGYGRIDLRMDAAGQLRVLEVNAQCGLSEDENYTSIGAILRLSNVSYATLIADILHDGLSRAAAPRQAAPAAAPPAAASAGAP